MRMSPLSSPMVSVSSRLELHRLQLYAPSPPPPPPIVLPTPLLTSMCITCGVVWCGMTQEDLLYIEWVKAFGEFKNAKSFMDLSTPDRLKFPANTTDDTPV